MFLQEGLYCLLPAKQTATLRECIKIREGLCKIIPFCTFPTIKDQCHKGTVIGVSHELR